MSRRPLLLFFLAAATSLGCAPGWHVVAQASPNPFQGHPSFAVLPVEYVDLRVGGQTEDEFLSQRTDQQRQSFAQDKAALDERFRAELVSDSREAGVVVTPADGPGDAEFSIRPTITSLDLGANNIPSVAHSKVEMRVRIVAADGIVVDDITLDQRKAALNGFGFAENTLDPSIGGRLRRDGEQLGKMVADYLRTRVAPGG
jgi:hypothetical protein